jgi:hypothetical protein
MFSIKKCGGSAQMAPLEPWISPGASHLVPNFTPRDIDDLIPTLPNSLREIIVFPAIEEYRIEHANLVEDLLLHEPGTAGGVIYFALLVIYSAILLT